MGIVSVALFLVGVGAISSFGICIMAIEMGRKKAPITYLSISERQGATAGEILRVRKKKYKDGTSGYEAKRAVLDGGIGCLFAKWTPVNPIERGYMMTKKTGGVIAITYSPCDNVELPTELHRDEKSLKMIVQTIDVGNWYRGALKQTVLSKLLNPKEGFWSKHPGAVIIMAGIIVFMMMIVGLIFIPQLATTHNAQLTSMIQSLSNSFSELGTNIGAAGSGAQVMR